MPRFHLGRSRTLAPASLLAVLAFLFAGVRPVSLTPTPAAADTVAFATATLPLPDEGAARWYFTGDEVVGLVEENKGGDCLGHFHAYSLTEPKALWHVDQVIGHKNMIGDTMVLPDKASDQWYVGKGPLSLLDLSTGTIRWTIPCDQSGFLMMDRARLLSGDRLLVPGAKDCDLKSDIDAMKRPQVTMINRATGQVQWRHETKSLAYDGNLGSWARLPENRGGKKKGKRQQLATMLVTEKGEFDEAGIYEPDRLGIVGEGWECVNLADGASSFKTEEKLGIFRGAYDGRVFFQNEEKVSAYTTEGATPVWTSTLKEKSDQIYTVDDLVARGDGVPDGMSDLFVSQSEGVSRVDMGTGRVSWTVARDRKGSWWGSKHALITETKDRVLAYDWRTGTKMWEAGVAGQPRPKDVGDVIILCGGKKVVDGEPQAPFTFTAVKGIGGQVLWSRTDVSGLEIVDWKLIGGQQIRFTNEDGKVANVNVVDGTAAKAPPAAGDQGGMAEGGYSVTYLEKKKTLQCHNYAGTLVWERKGENSMMPPYKLGRGCVIWASTDGTVEVVGLADGATKWKQRVASKPPQPAVNKDGTYMVIQNKTEVSIVKLGS